MPKNALGPLDEIIHPQARLAIMAYLNGIEGASFTTLRDALDEGLRLAAVKSKLDGSKDQVLMVG